MAQVTIDRLIINSPYEEPARHWRYDREMRLFSLEEGRRPAGYVVSSESSRAFDDPGIFVEIPLVNQIRRRVKAWREVGYPAESILVENLRGNAAWCIIYNDIRWAQHDAVQRDIVSNEVT